MSEPEAFISKAIKEELRRMAEDNKEEMDIENVVEKRPKTSNEIMKFFPYDHNITPMSDLINLFADLAFTLDEWLTDGPEKSTALRKLLESKDAALRAVST